MDAVIPEDAIRSYRRPAHSPLSDPSFPCRAPPLAHADLFWEPSMVLSESFVNYARSRDLSYSEVACVTLLTWDVLVMLSEEVELIWKRGWTPAKGLYFIARYFPWLVQLALLAINVNGTTGLAFTSGQCATWQIVQGVLLQLIVTTVDVILITRVYALYSRNHYLLVFLGSLFIAELTSLCYILVVVTPRLTYNDECYVTSSPSIFQYYWVISLAFETVLFVLTIVKFVDAVKQGWGKGPIMQQFVTDGTWAYTLIFLVMLVNMMLYKYVHSSLTGICYTWLLVVMSFAARLHAFISSDTRLMFSQGSRLVLNPRRSSASYYASTHTSDMEMSHMSSFGHFTRARADLGPGIMVTIERITDDPAWDKA
ncbi:hypothetical protein L226DRAFT_572888 [Lentinus tigrinus ALCF2SS1-7]|uniref:uncharacterized protein n=1 Tax=Lentinus tigrinus ALCF2SS1-7 TaxID=1328758 RepID=UPI001165FA7C|nr:hypothetical protein L226DRAFT_572888 [Lentinus tigrinus ALCF2SS1-7]